MQVWAYYIFDAVWDNPSDITVDEFWHANSQKIDYKSGFGHFFLHITYFDTSTQETMKIFHQNNVMWKGFY